MNSSEKQGLTERHNNRTSLALDLSENIAKAVVGKTKLSILVAHSCLLTQSPVEAEVCAVLGFQLPPTASHARPSCLWDL